MKKGLFICDGCGARTRLDNTQRHWCALCNEGAPVEMRYVKDKKPLMIDRAVDDNMLEGAAVRSAQSAYQERNFALHAAPSTPDGVQKSVNVRS